MADIRDIGLDTNGDLAFEGGDLKLLSGLEALVQSVRIRLSFFKGEWFLDLDAGVPYYQEMLGKKPRVELLRSVFRKAIEETPGIDRVISLSVTFNGAARRLEVKYRAASALGEISERVVL